MNVRQFKEFFAGLTLLSPSQRRRVLAFLQPRVGAIQ